MSIEVFNRTKTPYSAVVAIEVTFPDGYKARGTGAVVGVNDVLTATHVIYEPAHGGWATSLGVFPGADYNSALGYYQDKPYTLGAYTWRSTGWITQTFADQDDGQLTFAESQYDIAIIGVSVRLGDQTGWFGLASGYDSPQLAYALGYPRDSTGMMLAQPWVTKETGYGVYSSYGSNGGDLMGPGSSGGPLYVMVGGEPYLIGVKSSGTEGVSNHWADIGFLYDQIRTAIAANDSLLNGAAADDYLGSLATRGNLTVGGSLIGNIETGGDTDWFKVSLTAGITYQIGLAGATVGGGSIFDPILRLMNASGVQVAYNDDIDRGVNRNSRIDYSAVSTGFYYVEASGFLSETGTYTISIITADTTPPSVVSFSPGDGLTEVAATVNVVLTFSEAIQRGAGRIGLWNTSNGGSYVEYFDVANSTRLSVTGSTLTIDPTNALNGNTKYFVTFDAGNILDLAGNAFAGTYEYDFTVAAANRRPVVLAPMPDLNWIEGAPLQYTLPANTFSDPDGDVLSYSATLSVGGALPSWLNFDTATRVFTGTAPKGSPDYIIRVTATDTGGQSAYDDVTYFTPVASSGGQTFTGTNFNDRFAGGPGNDVFDGDSGIDTVVLTGVRFAHTIAKTFIGWTISSSASGMDKIVNVERLEFADKKLALDLKPTEHAGQALEFIGLMAPTLVNSPPTVGLILQLFDQGSSLRDVCQLALDVGLVRSVAGSDSDLALAAMAFRNIVGAEADGTMLDMLIGYMDGRSANFGQADFMTTLAGLDVNQMQIGLVGLQQTGVEYM